MLRYTDYRVLLCIYVSRAGDVNYAYMIYYMIFTVPNTYFYFSYSFLLLLLFSYFTLSIVYYLLYTFLR